MQPLIVLQVLPALDGGGVERGTLEVAQAIVQAGGTALVASAGGRLVPALERLGARHVTLPLATKSPLGMLRNALALERLVRAAGVRIVHARSRAPAWSAWLAARRAGVAFVTTYHAPYAERFPLKRQYNAVMARGVLVIAISRHVAALVAARHGVDPASIRTIPRGVDPAVFDPATVSGAALAAAWGLPEDAPVILLPGRLTRWKGQGVLIEALAQMRHTEAVAVLVGDAQGRHAYRQSLLDQAARLGVAERVKLVGHCDDMPAALALATVVVNPSLQPEGFGRVVIEAQAMARPVIAADHGGAAETIEHGVTGWRVPPGDAASLAAALDMVIDLPPESRATFGQAARRSVTAQYSVAALQAATLAMYREVLAV